jgi:aldehyde:ferredoxin oxidoreductase
MAYGNMGKILEVDLTTGATAEIELDDEIYRDYIGGAGLAAKLLYDRGNLAAGPLDPDNLLIFAAGPLTGIGFSGSSRLSVGARSPLTGIWGQASCGGNFGPELKRCGYDAIIFKGKSSKPVYLILGEDSAELSPAEDLWGKDTYETTDILKKRHGNNHKVLAIGPASENGVLYGSIVNDYGHLFGRAGMGTVMGSKNLKAISAQGSRKMEVKDRQRVDELSKIYQKGIETGGMARALRSFGTANNMEAKMIEGDVPSRNWGLGIWEEGGEKLSGIALDEEVLIRHTNCRGCGVQCKPVVEVEEGPYQMEEGPGPEYETLGAFGTMLMNSNIESVCKINDFCNRMGLDTITGGATFAWAMDCYENGLMKREDFDGVKLEWGDIDTVIEMLPKVVAREGKLGALLAKGSRAAAAEIGGGSEKFLTDSKGLEAPMHDPRLDWGNALAYAVSVRGACHVSNMNYLVEWWAVTYPEIGLNKHYTEFSTEHRGETVAKTSDLGCIFNSACWCNFPGTIFKINELKDMFNAVAGYGWELEDMMDAGSRVWFLQRCLAHIWGATAADDRVGERIMTPVNEGGIKGQVPDMETMLKDFYEYRGLGSDGKPLPETLEKIGLGYLVGKI